MKHGVVLEYLLPLRSYWLFPPHRAFRRRMSDAIGYSHLKLLELTSTLRVSREPASRADRVLRHAD
jgi:hypothetical protein